VQTEDEELDAALERDPLADIEPQLGLKLGEDQIKASFVGCSAHRSLFNTSFALLPVNESYMSLITQMNLVSVFWKWMLFDDACSTGSGSSTRLNESAS
jgi:hypothetical protein